MATVESNRGFVVGWSAIIGLVGAAILVAAAGRFSATQLASTIGVALGLGLLVAGLVATERPQARLPARQPLLTGAFLTLTITATFAAVAFEVLDLVPAIGLTLVLLAAVSVLLYAMRRRRE